MYSRLEEELDRPVIGSLVTVDLIMTAAVTHKHTLTHQSLEVENTVTVTLEKPDTTSLSILTECEL